MTKPLFLHLVLGILPAFPLALAAPAGPPDVRATSVTIPYAELRALWDAARTKPVDKPAPPLSHALSLARYAFELSPDLTSAECRATLEVTSFGDGWITVPLLSADVRIESIAPDATSLVLRDGFYTLVLSGAGKHVVTLRFAVRLANATGTAPGLRLAISPALISEASFGGVPAGSAVDVTEGVRVGGAGAAGTMFRLGAAPSLAFAIVGLERRAKKQAVAATWNADLQTLVAAEEGRLACRARILANGIEGDTAEMRLILPAAASVREVDSDNLERWDTTRSDDGVQRVVALRWSGPERFAREVRISYELPLTARDGEWMLTAPSVKGAAAPRVVFFVVARPGLEISAASAGDPGANAGLDEPGPALAAALGGSRYATIAAAPGEMVALVKVKRLPMVATSQARIDDAQFQMRVVADGSLLTDAKLFVRHDRPQALRVELPPGSELLACSVDEVEAIPIDRGGGSVEITLPAVTDGKPSRVAFSYSARAEKFAPVAGQVELILPRTELFTNSIGWDVQIPGAYELTAFEGNVELVSPARMPADPALTLVRLRKELCRGEAPRVALFYQKRAVNP